jgi:drug/metabolite transporter (DMT)-like permease
MAPAKHCSFYLILEHKPYDNLDYVKLRGAVMKLKSALMLSSVVFLWGSSFTLLKLGLEEIPPVTLAFLRFLVALPFVVAFTYSQDKNAFGGDILKEWKIFSALGFAGVTLYHVFQNFGLQLTTASNSSLIISANPVFIVLLAHFYLKERMTWKRVFGVAFAFSGVVLIIRPVEWSLDPIRIVGDLLSLGSAISWAFYSVAGRDVLSNYGANRVTMFSLIFGTLFLFPSTFLLEQPVLPRSLRSWFLLLVLSLFCSGLAYLFWSKALEDVSATKAGVFLFFLPVISVFVAHLVLSESLDVFLAIGALLVILGVVLTERS